MNLISKLLGLPPLGDFFFAAERKQLREKLRAETLARVDAEAALSIRSDLMAALGHELAAPLTPIVAELALLELEPHAAECSTSIRAIRKHVEEQIDVIARLLDSHQVPENEEEEADARPRILLVEDHEPTRFTLKQLLWRSGFRVQGAGTVKDAIAYAHDDDFMLCDISLPDGTGFEVMQALRKRSIRGVAITGYGSDEDARMAMEAGFSAYMTKPLDLKKLLRAIATYSSLTPRPTPPTTTPEANQERAA